MLIEFHSFCLWEQKICLEFSAVKYDLNVVSCKVIHFIVFVEKNYRIKL